MFIATLRHPERTARNGTEGDARRTQKKRVKAATFEDARFGTFGKEADEDGAHQSETQLYRDTWILPRLDRDFRAQLERKPRAK